jgi:hypothetical protein
MAAPNRQYTDEIFEKFGYWATWKPNETIKLGDCGPVSNRVFSPEASLTKDFGIDFDTTTLGDPADLQYGSSDVVDYRIQLAGGNVVIPGIPQGKAGIEVNFSRENGIVFVLRSGRDRRIANIHSLRETLLARTTEASFPREYAVVTNLMHADAATILISSSAGARFAASAEADLSAGLVELANVMAGLTRVAAQGLQTEFFAQAGLTPLFKLAGFKKGGVFWGAPTFKNLEFAEDADPGDLDEIIPSDLNSQ